MLPAVSAEEVDQQLSALTQLKNGISSDPLGTLSGWNTSAPYCNWTGVFCDVPSAARVIRIDLGGRNLSGTLTPHLSGLLFLSHLNLSFNNLSGTIPPQLASLPSLTHLHLYQNAFHGTIPSELGQSPALQWLDLSDNHLSGAIPASLGSLSSTLVRLDLSINQLSGSLPVELSQLTRLTVLNVSNNHFGGEIPSQLVSSLEYLTHLRLDVNNFSGAVPPALGGLLNLELLLLSTNNLSGSIPPELGRLSNLKQLRIDNNHLTGTIPPELGNLSNVLALGFYSNGITGRLPSELGNLLNLVELGFSENELSGTIPASLGRLENLSSLLVNYNHFTGNIPPELGNLTNLQRLYLSENRLSGHIPKEFGNLHSLQNLILYNNNLTGPLPLELGRLKKLVQLYLGTNDFKGTLPAELGGMESLQEFELRFGGTMYGEIPPSFANLTKLNYLDLSNNFFSMSMPSFLAKCTQLQWIKLGNNSFWGVIPHEYSTLAHLRTLSLWRNNLTGNLPSSFANHSSLVVLDLQHNHLEGTLPESWQEITKGLRVLLLGYNMLQGSLPVWLSNMSNLGILSLSNNNFEGPIPISLGSLRSMELAQAMQQEIAYQDNIQFEAKGKVVDLKYLPAGATSLDLSGNMLDGHIPEELGFLDGLYYLNLSRNRLTGQIPTKFKGLLTLESLDLSTNSLSGPIPSELTHLTYLSLLNVSYNNFSGPIPQGKQFDTFLNSSYLGNPYLCGFVLAKCNSQPQGAPGFSSSRGTNTEKLWIIFGTCIPLVIAFLGCIIIFFYCSSPIRAPRWIRLLWPSKAKVPEIWLFGKGKHLEMTTEDVFLATQGFNKNNILGSGGTSTVYKAVLKDNTTIAIKKFDVRAKQVAGATKSFAVECFTLSQIRHKNLLKLLGAYSSSEMKALILEYMENGSLESHLYPGKRGNCIQQNLAPCGLSWETRLKIAHGVAQGLAYLHGQSGSGTVIHCDIKPSNILLDDNFEPHISDFGIARLLALGKEAFTLTGGFNGTLGYIAPECARLERVTAKADVYGYGIILLELVTRRAPTSQFFNDGSSLRSWVCSMYPHKLEEIVDPELLVNSKDGNQGLNCERMANIKQLVNLGLRCAFDAPKERPTMIEVVYVVECLLGGVPITQHKPLETLLSG